MASTYVKKPRNVRSVYARPPADTGGELTGSECDSREESIRHNGNESTRTKRSGRKSAKACGGGSKQSVKCDTDVGGSSPRPKRHRGNKKSRGDDAGEQSAKTDSPIGSKSSKSSNVSVPVERKATMNSDVAKESIQSDTKDSNAGRETGECEIVTLERVELTQSGGNAIVNTELSKSANTVKTDPCESASNLEKQDNIGVYKDSDSSRTANKNHVCKVCEKTFSTARALTSHRKSHSNQEAVDEQGGKRRKKKDAAPLTCGDCDKVFKKASEFARHQVIHSGEKPFVCDICGMGFTQSGNLKNHKIIHTGERPFVCDVCNKTFIRNGDLKTHKMTHTGEKPFLCDICKKAFSTRDYLNSHKLIHTDHKPFVCDQCSMCFRKSSQLKAHLERHTGAKNFVCEVCNKAFSTKGILKTHMLIHTGRKTYVCHICAATLTRESSLKKHMMTHDKERPYVCSECNKGYIVKSEWEIHMRTHTGERPFICNICPATFARNANLQQHMNAVHLGKRPHVCDTCGKAFTERRSLKEHKLIHTGERPHKCSVCGKGFTQSSSLKTHMRIHSGDKPFPCKHCPKKFSDIGSRNRHHRTHTGETPYKCSQCPSAFSRSEQYKNHLQSAHSDFVSETADTIEQSVYGAQDASVSADAEAEKNLDDTISSPPGDVSCGPTIVVEAVVLDDSAFNAASDIPSGSPVVQPLEVLDSSALNPVGGILPGQTIVVKSVENHDASSGHAIDCQTSVEEHYIFPQGTTVIYQSMPPHSSSHLGSSGSEIIEYTIIEEPVMSDPALPESQFSHEDDVSGTVIIEPQRNEQIIEVQGDGQGLPSHVIKLKVEDGTTIPGLSIVESEDGFSGSVAEDMQVDYSENATTLAVIESQADSEDYPSDMAVDDLHIDHTENMTSVTVIESHAQTDFDNDPAVDQLHINHTKSSSPKVIDMQQVENIQVIESGSVDDDTAADHYSAIRDLLKKPLLESTDQSPNHVPPLVTASNTNRKAHNNTKPTLIVIDAEASALSDAAKKRKRKFGQSAKNWICEICGNGFTQRCSLKKHIAVQHKTGSVKFFECNICSKPCASKSEMEAHKRSHTGDRPFKCHHCKNSYKHKADLQQHILAGHMRERPHVCDVCQRAFTEKRSLKDHKLIHEGVKPHKCLTCGKAFTQSSSLKNHQRVHSGLKPWVCQHCGKDFCDHSTFNRHQRIHTGEKPHQCQQCPRAFARSEQLKKHKNREHPGNLQNLATLAAVATIS